VRGNLIGTYANVENIITVQGNVGNVRMVGGNVEASYFIGDGSLLTGITGGLTPNPTFNNVIINNSIKIGGGIYSPKIYNIHKTYLDGTASSNVFLLTSYTFPDNTFHSGNVVVCTNVLCDDELLNADRYFIACKNYGYNQYYNRTYIQVRNLLGTDLNLDYVIEIIAIEVDDSI
jgi:hypothetical protein